MSEKKRRLPAKVASMKGRKRRKLGATEPAAENKALVQAPKRKVKVHIDSLAWNEITLPDRMGDYEGLAGLIEEVEDVHLERDEAGRVSYHSLSAIPTDAAKVVPNHEAPPSVDDDDAESWSGFGDDADVPASEAAKISSPSKVLENGSRISKSGNAASGKDIIRNGNSHFKNLLRTGEDDSVDVTAWKSLRLSPDTMASLGKLKFGKPTPIQQAVIPRALEGHDIIGKASTGSGKTLAFGIPILERFLEMRLSSSHKKCQSPLALILSPTRELAHQLDKHLTSLFEPVFPDKPSIATLTGGLSLQKQQRLLRDADVVIGTPGRLWEVISLGTGVMAALKQINFLVIDEADRLLSQGHFKEVEEILNSLDRVDRNEEVEDSENQKECVEPTIKRQTLVLSATFDRALQNKLVGKLNRKDNLLDKKETLEYLLSKINFREEVPKFIDVNPVNQLALGLREGLVECGGTEKDLYLYALLLLKQASRAMVFTNSISAVRRITPLLQNLNLNALPLHSGMPQKARLRSVERFSQANSLGKISPVILIATDVAARGLDIPDVNLIVHYHLPRAADMYVHRSGRTARAGQEGSSILICAPEEVAGVRRLIAKVHARSTLAKGETASDAAKQGYYIRTLNIDRRVVSRLKERITLAKRLADATIATEKQHKEDNFMRAAAEELGVDYDSEEFEKQASGRHGRGSGRKKKEREARQMPKAEIGALKAQLKQLLGQRVNVGVSEKYPTAGNIDIDELLRQKKAGGGKTGDFLGAVENTGLEDL